MAGFQRWDLALGWYFYSLLLIYTFTGRAAWLVGSLFPD